MIATLGSLLSDSWHAFRRAFVTVFIGAVIFGLIQGASQSFVSQRVTEKAGVALQNVGFDAQEMQELQERIQAGDETAVREFQQKVEALGGSESEALTGAMITLYKNLLPVMGASILLLWLVMLVASAYFLLVGLYPDSTFGGALARTPGAVIPLFLLWLWIFLRTFMWIPLIGIVTGIVLCPRFALSPVLLVRDHKGVLESASLSYGQTRGYWGKIFGNMLVAGILSMACATVVNVVLSVFGSTGLLLTPVVSMLSAAFISIFLVKLSIAILQSPRNA